MTGSTAANQSLGKATALVETLLSRQREAAKFTVMDSDDGDTGMLVDLSSGRSLEEERKAMQAAEERLRKERVERTKFTIKELTGFEA